MTSVILLLPLHFYFLLEFMFSHLCYDLADFQLHIHNIHLFHPDFFSIISTKNPLKYPKPNQLTNEQNQKNKQTKKSPSNEEFLMYESHIIAGSQVDSFVSDKHE